MLPDQVSNPGPLNYESGALPIALRGLARGRFQGSCYGSTFQVKYFIPKTLPFVAEKINQLSFM